MKRRLFIRLHAARRMMERGIGITAYRPDPDKWEDGFERRKQ